MYLVLVEGVDNQWIFSAMARFIGWIPLGPTFHSMLCLFDSVVLRSCFPHDRSCAMYLVLVEEVLGQWILIFFFFFVKNRGGGSRIALLSPPVVGEAHQGCFRIPSREVVIE